MDKLWGKRFEEVPDETLVDFMAGRDVRSVPPCDEDLISYDILGSKAHTIMLAKQGIITKEEARAILGGLIEVQRRFDDGSFRIDPGKEDVHTNIEAYIIERYGIEQVGNMHTARSRNDQIAVDIRLWMRDKALFFLEASLSLISALIKKAMENLHVVIPGYTHYQPAMLTTLGHLLTSFGLAISRDAQRFRDWYTRFNKNPLGGVSSFSTTFPIDRLFTSRLLGFDGAEENSIDPITNRWEPESELAFALSVNMNHLSTISQTFILLSTQEFGILEIGDKYKSGSSIMPQKKNPCALEVIKAKCALAKGYLVSLLSIGQSSFFGYNRDTQWTKYVIADLVRECKPTMGVLAGVVSSLRVREETLSKRLTNGFVTSTAILEAICQRFGLSFREAKPLVEEAVRTDEKQGLSTISFPCLARLIKKAGFQLDEDWFKEISDPMRIIESKGALGGTSPQSVKDCIKKIKQGLEEQKRWLNEKKVQIEEGKSEILSFERSLGLH